MSYERSVSRWSIKEYLRCPAGDVRWYSPQTVDRPVVDTLRDLTEILFVQRLQGRQTDTPLLFSPNIFFLLSLPSSLSTSSFPLPSPYFLPYLLFDGLFSFPTSHFFFCTASFPSLIPPFPSLPSHLLPYLLISFVTSSSSSNFLSLTTIAFLYFLLFPSLSCPFLPYLQFLFLSFTHPFLPYHLVSFLPCYFNCKCICGYWYFLSFVVR